jgi:hypothetical protein
MTNIELVSFIASVASLIMALVAMWQAVHFYNQAKTAELNTATTLESIKTQAAMLEKMTARWMDRFTKYVTTPKEADETTTRLIELIEVKQQLALSLPSPQDSARQKAQFISELITSYIAIFYYVGLTNLTTQSFLPTQIENLQPDDAIKRIVDQSNTDYLYILGILNSNQEQVATSSLNHLYQQAITFKSSVKDSTQVYSTRAAEASQQADS